MIVAHTHVVSEPMRPSPVQAVRDWVGAQKTGTLCTSAITVAEIRCGLQQLADDSRKNRLLAAADEVFTAFSEFILPFDARAAARYAPIVARRDRIGLPIDGFDAQIAAICQAHDALLATRNVTDFRETGIGLIDPWEPVPQA